MGQHSQPCLILSLAYVWLIGKVGYLISTGSGRRRSANDLWRSQPDWPVDRRGCLPCGVPRHLSLSCSECYPPYGEWFEPLDIIQGY